MFILFINTVNRHCCLIGLKQNFTSKNYRHTDIDYIFLRLCFCLQDPTYTLYLQQCNHTTKQ